MVPLHVLECPSCGANLNCDGGSQETIICEYCGKLIEVLPGAPAVSMPPIDPAAVTDAVYARLRVHNKVGAINIYMELTHVSLEEAEAAVENMMRTGLSSAGPLPPPDISSLDLSDPEAVNAKISELARAGFMRLAVDIYMRVYEVEAKEAYKAVEAIEHGDTAPAQYERADTEHDKDSDKKKKHGLFGW